MINERRYYDYHSIFTEQKFDGINIISVGSEMCIHLFPNSDSLKKILLICKEKGKIAKCVFPRIDAFSVSKMDEIMEILIDANQDIQVVINDWGCLQYSRDFSGKIEFYLGRQLTRSIVDCPWYESVIEGEDDDIKRDLLQIPFYFQEKLNMLHEYGISGFELNSIKDVEESISVLSRLGWKISVHLNEYLLTCGKNCISQRILKSECDCGLCMEKIYLNPIQKWKNLLDTKEQFTEYEKKLLFKMYARGKAVYLPQTLSEEKLLCNKDITNIIETV